MEPLQLGETITTGTSNSESSTNNVANALGGTVSGSPIMIVLIAVSATVGALVLICIACLCSRRHARHMKQITPYAVKSSFFTHRVTQARTASSVRTRRFGSFTQPFFSKAKVCEAPNVEKPQGSSNQLDELDKPRSDPIDNVPATDDVLPMNVAHLADVKLVDDDAGGVWACTRVAMVAAAPCESSPHRFANPTRQPPGSPRRSAAICDPYEYSLPSEGESIDAQTAEVNDFSTRTIDMTQGDDVILEDFLSEDDLCNTDVIPPRHHDAMMKSPDPDISHDYNPAADARLHKPELSGHSGEQESKDGRIRRQPKVFFLDRENDVTG